MLRRPQLPGFARRRPAADPEYRRIFASQHLMNRCLIGEEEPDDILAGAEETLLRLGEDRVKSGLVSPRQVIDEYQGGLNAFLDPSKRVKGISTGFTKLDEKTTQQEDKNKQSAAKNAQQQDKNTKQEEKNAQQQQQAKPAQQAQRAGGRSEERRVGK